MDLLFTDVWGPSSIASINVARYYVSFVDDFSRYTWLFPISSKSDMFRIFSQFHIYVERLFERKIKAIQTDWGGEFQKLNPLLAKLGISHRISCPHTHQ